MKKLYVGNLPFSMNDETLRELFAERCSVVSANVVIDRETGRSRGFGFVEVEDGDAQPAIEAFDGQDCGGRPLKVNEARPREPRSGGFGGGGGGGGRGGYGGGGGGGRRSGGGGGGYSSGGGGGW